MADANLIERCAMRAMWADQPMSAKDQERLWKDVAELNKRTWRQIARAILDEVEGK